MKIVALLKNKAELCDAILQNHEKLWKSLTHEQWEEALKIFHSLIELQKKIEALDVDLSDNGANLARKTNETPVDEIEDLTRLITQRIESARHLLNESARLATEKYQTTASDLNTVRKMTNLLKAYTGDTRESAYWLDSHH